MGKTEFVIPKAIRDAVHNALASYPVAANTGHAAEIACEAFAKALSENPIVPTDEQIKKLLNRVNIAVQKDMEDRLRDMLMEWQRIMLLEPDPEVPEVIKDMLLDARSPDSEHCFFKPSVYNERITEAYRRGKESRKP